jgi:predicted double-glycine peptidase
MPPLFAGPVLSLLVTLAQVAGAPQQKAGIWLDVPFVKQTEDGCGSASIAMVLRYWSVHGMEISAQRQNAEAIQKELYSPKAHGIFASDMERYLRESGFREFALRGDWGDLRQHLTQGRPLIVSIQPGKSSAPLHYAVVTGMDFEHEAVFVHDPARGKLLRIERPEFEKEWVAARNWMLLALPARAN